MEDCPICLSPCDNGCETPCGHHFHDSCLADWLSPALYRAIWLGSITCQSTPVSTCPCCRSEIECWFVLAVLKTAIEKTDADIVCEVSRR